MLITLNLFFDVFELDFFSSRWFKRKSLFAQSSLGNVAAIISVTFIKTFAFVKLKAKGLKKIVTWE